MRSIWFRYGGEVGLAISSYNWVPPKFSFVWVTAAAQSCYSFSTSASPKGLSWGLPLCCARSLQSCPTLRDPMDYSQAPLSMGFSRQEYWSGLPCPPPGDLPNHILYPARHTPGSQMDSIPRQDILSYPRRIWQYVTLSTKNLY